MMNDDPTQSSAAQQVPSDAMPVVIPTVAMCEFAWVLSSYYKLTPRQIALPIRRLLESQNIKVEYADIETGLAVLDTGGNLADGAIASEGRRLGGMTFASLDRAALKRLGAQGLTVLEPTLPR